MTEEQRAEHALGITRGLEGDGVRCVVSHPDVGGKCEDKAMGTVYGLPFCARHFGEARAGALAELGGAAGDLLSAFAPSPDIPAVGEALGYMLAPVDHGPLRSDYYDLSAMDAAKRAYPFREELVAPETRAFERAPGKDHPTDHWAERVGIMRRYMRIAFDAHDCRDELLAILEPLREQAVA